MNGISQEMTMPQLRSEQTSLSSSSKTNTNSEQRSVDANDEDPNFILTGRKKIEERHSVEEDANEDFNFRLSGIDDIVSSGSLSISELAEMIKTQQYEITQLRKENNLLKSKLIKASQQGFKV